MRIGLISDTHGLLRASFIPPQPIRELRDLTRHRRTLIEQRAQEVYSGPQKLDRVIS